MTRRKVLVSDWRECPRCRYPMVRWEKLTREPERIWVNWNPDESILPVQLLIMGGLFLLAFAVPWLGDLLFGGRHGRGWAPGLVESVGLGLAFLSGYTVYLIRQRRREKLAQTLRPQDWICARCLHSEPAVDDAGGV